MADEKKPTTTERRYGTKVKHHGTSSPAGDTGMSQAKNSAKAEGAPKEDGPVGKSDSGPTASVDAGTDGIPVNERHESERSEMHTRHTGERRQMFQRHGAEIEKMGKRHLAEMAEGSPAEEKAESPAVEKKEAA